MTQNKEATLLDSIQSEVSREATPMLDFLVKHARKIFMALIALIAAIVVFGVWNYMNGSKQREAEEALGKILIMPDSAAKLDALAAFAGASAPEHKNAALMALAQSATTQKQYDKAFDAWAEVGKSADASIRFVANIAQGALLSAQGKNSEALSLFENIQASAPAEAQPMINSYIASVAEQLGDWDKAIAACDAIIRQAENPDAKDIWEQRLAYYAAKK